MGLFDVGLESDMLRKLDNPSEGAKQPRQKRAKDADAEIFIFFKPKNINTSFKG